MASQKAPKRIARVASVKIPSYVMLDARLFNPLRLVKANGENGNIVPYRA